MKRFLYSSGLVYHANPQKGALAYVQEGMRMLKQIGFDAVDYDTSIGLRKEDVEAVRNDMLALNLPFRLCHLPFVAQKNGVPGSAFNQVVFNAIDIAKLLEVDYAVIHPNSATLPLEGYNAQEQYDLVAGYLAPFAEYAHKAGVQIVLENMRTVHQAYPAHRYCANPDELCKVADALGMGICWDTGHAHITGLKQSEALSHIGSRLKMVHLNDNFGDDDIHLAPFMGSADWKDIMEGLSAIGFEGLLNFELSTGRIPADLRIPFGAYVIEAAKKLETYMKG